MAPTTDRTLPPVAQRQPGRGRHNPRRQVLPSRAEGQGVQLGGGEAGLHLPAGLLSAMVVLLRRNAAARVRRVHDQPGHLLEWFVRMLNLVVHERVMLSGDGALIAILGPSLAAVAGAAQLFSP